jgi:5-methylcytosine-specific restriction endonuclease McrA
MTTFLDGLEALSDQALLSEVQTAAQRERADKARLIALLTEVDQRRLYLGEGCASLFAYCTQVLRLSEHAAYGRIEAARAARRFPIILQLLVDGAITLTTVTLLAPHLTFENHESVLQASRHKSRREVEQMVAALRPQPDVPPTIRRVAVAAACDPQPAVLANLTPAPAPPDARAMSPIALVGAEKRATSLSQPPRAAVAPLSPERYKIQCTISCATHDKLRRAQELLRHAIPSGDLAMILDRALTLLLADLERAKAAKTDRPRKACSAPGSRHIPAAVRRAVWQRDGGQCAFVGAVGRCTERGFLEFHHLEPFATGGPPTVVNIALRCRAHNRHEAEQYFGDRLPLLLRESRPAYVVNSVRTESMCASTTPSLSTPNCSSNDPSVSIAT